MPHTRTVREIALEQPASIRIFEKFGIDYCCGGRKPLAEACAQAGIEPDAVLAAIAATAIHVPTGTDWQQAPLAALIHHIITTHHAYAAREIPRLVTLAEKVVNRHGDTHPELPAIRINIAHLEKELASHFAKEENILFPGIIELERAHTEGAPLPRGCFGAVANPIAMMTSEHDAAGALLAEIRQLSLGYNPPPNACPTYVGFYVALREFEQDLHQHIHLENNILFPRALALEASAAAVSR